MEWQKGVNKMHVFGKAGHPIPVTKKKGEFAKKVGPEHLPIKIIIQMHAKKPPPLIVSPAQQSKPNNKSNTKPGLEQ